MPNSAIAQGSIFVVVGSGLGPAAVVTAGSFPLSTTLAGTSAQVTVGGVTVSPIMLYSMATQVAMVMPSSTPVGSGVISITYNGQTSSSTPIQVSASNFGMFAQSQAGEGPAVITDINYQPITLTHAANPSQILTIWGTGLGKISSDEKLPPPVGNVGPKPVVWVGSQSAAVSYWGRSSNAGLDQINFEVPAGTSGCYVSVAVQIGSSISNFGSLAVAPTGSVCSDPLTLTSSQLSNAQNGQNTNIASLALLRSIVTTSTTTVTTDSGSATFLRYTPAQLSSSNFGQAVSAGSCMVYPINGDPTVTDPAQPLGLGAGTVTIGGSNGTKTLGGSLKGYYSGSLASGSAGSALYLDPGTGPHTFNGFGGVDVGDLLQEVNMPPTPTWTNQSSTSTVSASLGLTVSWTNATPGGYVKITGYSFLQDQTGKNGSGASFTCTSSAGSNGSGQFAIPSAVLLSMPLSGSSSSATPSGFLGIASETSLQRLPAIRGIDFGFAHASVLLLRSVNYIQ
jgi:uncharacterized protein (TIGR03437 family)